MYNSMAIGTEAGAATVTSSLETLPWIKPVTSLTMCGHSLGGALATMLALDVAANADPPFNNPMVYTYASPRTGDTSFVNMYNHLVPNSSRVANRVDLVPKLPMPALYDYVLGLFDLSSVSLLPLPKVLVNPDPVCSHILTTYLHLLSSSAGELFCRWKRRASRSFSKTKWSCEVSGFWETFAAMRCVGCIWRTDVTLVCVAFEHRAQLNCAHHEMLTTVFGFSSGVYFCRFRGARATA